MKRLDAVFLVLGIMAIYRIVVLPFLAGEPPTALNTINGATSSSSSSSLSWPPPSCVGIDSIGTRTEEGEGKEEEDIKTTSCDSIHEFDCHIRVCRHQLLDLQVERYEKNNLHEPVETKVFAALMKYSSQPNDVFVDVGAAIGYYMMLAIQINPNMYAYGFNPSTEFQRHVQANVHLNNNHNNHNDNDNKDNGKQQELAIEQHMCLDPRAVTSEDNGKLLIGNHYGDGIKSQDRVRRDDDDNNNKNNNNEKTKSNQARTVRFDTFLRELHPIIPFCVMLDIQGAELDAIEAIANNNNNNNDDDDDDLLLSSGQIPLFFVGIHGTFPKIRALFEKSQAYDLLVAEPQVDLQPDGIILAVSKTTKRRKRIERIVKLAQQHIGLPYDQFLETVGAQLKIN